MQTQNAVNKVPIYSRTSELCRVLSPYAVALLYTIRIVCMAAKHDCCSLRSVCWIPTLMPRDAKLYSNRAAALTKVWLMLVSGCISHKKHFNWCSVSKTSKYQVSREKKTQFFPQLLAYPDALRDLDECLKTLRQVLQRSHNTAILSELALSLYRSAVSSERLRNSDFVLPGWSQTLSRLIPGREPPTFSWRSTTRL